MARRDDVAGRDGVRGRLGDSLGRHFKAQGPLRHGGGDLLAWLSPMKEANPKDISLKRR